MKNKFKKGDLVEYIGPVSETETTRKIGDVFLVDSLIESKNSFRYVYFPSTSEDGEYECDLKLATKLHRVLL